MLYLIYLYIFAFSLILSLILTHLMRRLAVRFKVLAQPSPEKFPLAKPMPLLGGLAIFLSFNLTLLINLGLLFLFKASPRLEGFIPAEIAEHIPGILKVLPRLTAILFCGFLLTLVGLFDDIREMKPWVKLVSQIFVGIILVSSGVRITLFLPEPFFGGLLTVLWVVGISNAFNLLDNMDGLSCGVGFIAAAVLFAVTLQTGQVFVGLMLVLFLGATLGFLKFNFSPASVFMGDAGSLFIGYMLSLLTVMATFYTTASPTLIPVIMPLLILSVPIFDTVSVVYLRIKQKKPVFRPDKSHFSHRLVKLGMNEKKAVLFIYLLTFIIGLGALLLKHLAFMGSIIVLIQALGIIAIIILLERKNV